MKQGHFISWEGIDGSGKSSSIESAKLFLQEQGFEVVCTREVGGTPVAEKIRSLLLHDEMSIEAEVMMAFAARFEHLSKVVLPALKEGKVVLTDRYVDSTYAFQGYGRGFPLDRIQQLESFSACPRPNLTLLFDLPLDVAMSRMQTTRNLDRFEREHSDFHYRVRNGYLERMRQDPFRIKLISSDQSPEGVQASVRECIRLYLSATKATRA